jgi:hypothetical protein
MFLATMAFIRAGCEEPVKKAVPFPFFFGSFS